MVGVTPTEEELRSSYNDVEALIIARDEARSESERLRAAVKILAAECALDVDELPAWMRP